MKNLLIIFLLTTASVTNAQIFYNETKAEAARSERERMLNRERVKRNHIREVKIYGFKSDTSAAGYIASECMYDEQGNMTEAIDYNKHGKIRYRYTYAYDGKGRNVAFAEWKRNGKLRFRYVYVYDATGNETETRNYYVPAIFGKKEKLGWRNSATFDGKQNMLELKYFFSEDEKELFSRYSFTYYEDGSKKQTTEFDKKNKIRHKWNYDCNPAGTEAINLKDTSRICIRFETDKDGNKIRVKEEIVHAGKVARIVSRFDKQDHLLDLVRYDSNGGARTHESNTFDDKDNQTSYTCYKRNSDEVKYRSVFRYDEAGNISEIVAYKSSALPDRVMKFHYGK